MCSYELNVSLENAFCSFLNGLLESTYYLIHMTLVLGSLQLHSRAVSFSSQQQNQYIK